MQHIHKALHTYSMFSNVWGPRVKTIYIRIVVMTLLLFVLYVTYHVYRRVYRLLKKEMKMSKSSLKLSDHTEWFWNVAAGQHLWPSLFGYNIILALLVALYFIQKESCFFFFLITILGQLAKVSLCNSLTRCITIFKYFPKPLCITTGDRKSQCLCCN